MAFLAIALEAVSLHVFNRAGETLCLVSMVPWVLQLCQRITTLTPNAKVTETLRSKTERG